MHLTKSPINKEELSQLMLDEAEKEGWSYSSDDVEFYLTYFGQEITAIKVDGDLAGCFILHRSRGRLEGEPICSAGFLLILEKYRGQKIMGPFIWETFIPSPQNEDRFICFHSVPRAVNLYQRIGFAKTELVNIFYTLDTQNVNHKGINTISKAIKLIDKDNIHDINKYTNSLFKGESGLGFCEFIQQWQQRQDATTMAFYDKGIIKGYGTATICKEHDRDGKPALTYRLSPIYADSNDIADALVKALVYYAIAKNAQMIQLNSLAEPHTPFGQSFRNIGFMPQGKNYIVSNYPEKIRNDAPILHKIFASLPLEYAHEVAGGFY